MNIFIQLGLSFFFFLFFGLCFAWGGLTVWRRMEKQRKNMVALAFMAVACTIIAQKVKIYFDELVQDAGTYATNDVFHVSISNATAYAGVDFSAADVIVYARQHGLTNAEDWVELSPRRTFAQLPADYAIANATNFDYSVWLDYVPPSPVHTNGVFELHGFEVFNSDAETGAGFINSRPIVIPAPPNE